MHHERRQAGLVATSTVAILATVIGLSRIVGLRSFSKMSSSGDVSVLQGGAPIDPSLLEGVRGVPISSARPAGGC